MSILKESRIREIVAEEIKKRLTVIGWAGLKSNGCGYSHVSGGASLYWDGKVLEKTKSGPSSPDNSPVRTI